MRVSLRRGRSLVFAGALALVGGALMAAPQPRPDTSPKRAKEIVGRTGGEDVSSTGETSVDSLPERTMRKRAGGVE